MIETALIWMSAGNSYFSESNIGKLLHFADAHFQKIMIVSPEKPAEHNFRAAGYPENQVRKKATHDANLLKNRAERQLVTHRNATSLNWTSGLAQTTRGWHFV